MKKIIMSAALFAVFAFGASAQDKPAVKPAPAPAAQPGNMAAFKWVETTHDFGKIPQGKPVTHEFKFTNTGKAPLVLSQVQASCGCTTPDYSKEPIAPGKTGTIKATFNAGAVGVFNKSITVNANVEGGATYLILKGEVSAPETTK
ncbi:MAG TPA: DUF1573 domain-containing protein [Catalimonadaceae bacterium]|nr:DUF1573 domain-containing protein [Catalimonadaceae bacterium]HPI11030.1 DUF1573 domain-containing protein [Catalimonadaceae bacterium]